MKSFYEWCVKNNREDLLKEWHPTKNGNLTLQDINCGSSIKYWWQCEKGHEWQATADPRTKSNRCPYCRNKRVLQGYNDLATIRPDIAKEWHPTKNGDLKPTMITFGTNQKVWWQCEKGHEWDAPVVNRTGQNQGCPICSNKRVLQGYNDLATTHPELAKEWHPTKNGDLKPTMVTFGTNQKIWWQCEKGHEWDASVVNRTGQNQGCPICSNRRLVQGINDLNTLNPRVAKEWHPTRNGDLKPEGISVNSTTKVWWQCEKGHEWQATIINRTLMRQNCPKCSEGRHVSFPEKAIFYYVKQVFPNAEENFKIPYTRNSEIDIFIENINLGIEYDGVYYHRNTHKDEQKYKICSEYGINLLRIREQGCKKHENIAHCCYDLRGTKDSDLDNAIKFIFQYINNNYQSIELPNIDVSRDTVHIFDLIELQDKENSLINRNPEIAKEWHPTKNGKLTPSNMAENSNIKVWWQCKKGHEWQASIADRNRGNRRCPICSNKRVLQGYNDLATTHPELAKEWHPTKNGDLKPTDVIAGAERKVWWMCDKGHEWEATLVNRTRQNQGCPYCSNQRLLVGYNDLATTHPELAKEWHPTKNGDLKPTDVVSGGGKKFWWICLEGHEWQATIGTRKTGSGCPVCSIFKLYAGYNDLATTHPELAKEWHPTKNGDLKPTDIISRGKEKYWWQCEKGHEWQASITARKLGSGCPVCGNFIVKKGYNDLATTHPELAKEWHPTKNGDLKPADVVSAGGKKVWWQCEKGHEWQATIISRKNGSGCPVCANKQVLQGYNDLATTHPDIAKEWHPTKNGDLKPTDVVSGNNKKIWWQCEKGHEWEAVIETRSLYNAGCPYCSNKRVLQGYNDLATTHPELAKEWHPTKNGDLKPADVVSAGGKKVWWQCEKGHEWQATIISRKNGSGCPVCANKQVLQGYNDLATTHPDIAKEWHPTKNGDLKPTDVLIGSKKKIWWQCEKGHEWEAVINDRKKGGCAYCSNKKILKGYNDLATTHPELAKEWHPTKNGDLMSTQIFAGSHHIVWWKCSKCGYEYQEEVRKKVRKKYVCPKCKQ